MAMRTLATLRPLCMLGTFWASEATSVICRSRRLLPLIAVIASGVYCNRVSLRVAVTMISSTTRCHDWLTGCELCELCASIAYTFEAEEIALSHSFSSHVLFATRSKEPH